MVKKIKTLILVILVSQLNTHCQMKQEQKIPEFQTEISHPNNKYPVTPIHDYIKTLEGIPAGLPYGSSSGSWGSSGKSWTEQKGTPIGFEITYYSIYDSKYYEINENFDLIYIKEMTGRCYAWSDHYSETPIKEFIYRDAFNNDFQTLRDFYAPFSTLVFGFAPQGMVVVWMRYGGAGSIELGRFQAKEITDKNRLKELKENYLSTYRLSEERYKEEQIETYVADASPLLWDNYRIKYNWNYNVTSDNANFRFLGVYNNFFNGESEDLFRPFLNAVIKKRAVPEMTTIYWETGPNNRYEGKLFFNWEKTNELLKESGKENNSFNIHIDSDNNKIEIKLNDTVIAIDSVRIYSNSLMRFRDSYEE